MFGSKKPAVVDTDKLTVQVHVVASAEAFQLGQKIWSENARTVRTDIAAGKEFMHFVYANPTCVVWLQRELARPTHLELIVRWKDGVHEVYVIQNSAPPTGNDQRLIELLHSMLTVPSVVLAKEGSAT